MVSQRPGCMSSGAEARSGHQRLETHPDEPDLFWSAETPTCTVPQSAAEEEADVLAAGAEETFRRDAEHSFQVSGDPRRFIELIRNQLIISFLPELGVWD